MEISGLDDVRLGEGSLQCVLNLNDNHVLTQRLCFENRCRRYPAGASSWHGPISMLPASNRGIRGGTVARPCNRIRTG